MSMILIPILDNTGAGVISVVRHRSVTNQCRRLCDTHTNKSFPLYRPVIIVPKTDLRPGYCEVKGDCFTFHNLIALIKL